MGRFTPFRFDRDFDLLLAQAAEPDAAPPPPARYGEEDLVAARAEGYAAGHQAGHGEAMAAIGERSDACLAALAGALADIARSLGEDEAEMTRQASMLALALCRKVLPDAYRAAAGAAVCELVEALLPRLSREPLLTVRVPPPLAGDIEAHLAAIVRRHAFPGRLAVVADASLDGGDCRIAWQRGGLIRDWTLLWREIDALMADATGLAVTAPAAALPGDQGAPAVRPALNPPFPLDKRDLHDA